MEKVRIYEMPKCKMVASQCSMFGEGKLEKFDEWFSQFPRELFPKDFLWYDKKQNGFIWYYIYDDSMDVPNDFDIVDFDGGLYAVITGIDEKDSTEEMNIVKKFINEHDSIEEDITRVYLGNVITSPKSSKILGYEQMDYYVPIKEKTK